MDNFRTKNRCVKSHLNRCTQMPHSEHIRATKCIGARTNESCFAERLQRADARGDAAYARR
jgi:hypothetical protein